MENIKPNITYDDFAKVDIRSGEIIEVKDFKEARKPAYKLWIDFGAEIGVKQSSAQITELYDKDSLLHRKVMAVVNFFPLQVATLKSEVLTLGFENQDGHIVLAGVDKGVPNGSKFH